MDIFIIHLSPQKVWKPAEIHWRNIEVVIAVAKTKAKVCRIIRFTSSALLVTLLWSCFEMSSF